MKQRADGRWEKTKRINGKTIHFYSSEPTQRKAEKDIERQMFEYATLKAEEESNSIKFKSIAGEWEKNKREEITTWNKSYKGAYSEIVDYFGEYAINEIKPDTVINYFNLLRKRNYGLKTVLNRKSILSMIFTQALILGKINNNFISDLPLPSGLRKTPRKAPDQSDIEIIKSHSTGEDFLYFFLAYTGLRISEACALTFEDFDFENNTITVNKKITWLSNTPILVRQTKTGAGMRDVPILKKLLTALPTRWSGYLFSADDGKTPLTESQVRRITIEYNKRHNTNITPHQLRHAFAALGVEADLNVKELQYILGHSDIHTTMDIYAEIRDKQKHAITKKLNTVDY